MEQGRIPENPQECFDQLQQELAPEGIEAIRNSSEDDLTMLHLQLGMWIRNNWGLWEGSKLAEWFRERGVEDPDDMSEIIIHSFWLLLNDKPVNLEEQLKGRRGYSSYGNA